MKKEKISRVSVITSMEAEEPIAAALERLFSAAPSIYTNVEKGHSVISVYSETATAELRQKAPEIRAALEGLKEFGLDLGAGEISIEPVPREDWSESWKKYFKTIQVGRALMIKPSWSKQKAAPKQAVVVLDPGLSFGTGQHATTSFCLKQITALRRNLPLSLLDIGTGSGILAIAAAKLGYSPVIAFDFDPVSVRAARKNCRQNRVEKKVAVTRRDLTRMPLASRAHYDVICANLISTLLISERDRILNRLAPGGTLLLAGILATEFKQVQSVYEGAGLQLTSTVTENEWQSGAFGASL